MANKYTQMFFTVLLTVHCLHTHYTCIHTMYTYAYAYKKRRSYTFVKQKEMDSNLNIQKILWNGWTNEQRKKERNVQPTLHTQTQTHTRAHTLPSKYTQYIPYTQMLTLCIQTNKTELLTRIIAITLNWYYRWQNIEKSCWDRFWLILSSFTIITHIDAIFPRHFDSFEFFTHFIAS